MLFLIGKKAADALAMLQTAYEENDLDKAQLYESFGHFERVQMYLEDDSASWQRWTSYKNFTILEKKRGIEEMLI